MLPLNGPDILDASGRYGVSPSPYVIDLTPDDFKHVAYGTVNAYHYGLAHDTVTDDEFIDSFDSGDGGDVPIIEAASCLDLQTVFAGELRPAGAC